jgi:hypothetical protein
MAEQAQHEEATACEAFMQRRAFALARPKAMTKLF